MDQALRVIEICALTRNEPPIDIKDQLTNHCGAQENKGEEQKA